MEKFHWIREPLCNNLVVVYKKQYLINNTKFSHLEIAEPLYSNSGTLVENHWFGCSLISQELLNKTYAYINRLSSMRGLK